MLKDVRIWAAIIIIAVLFVATSYFSSKYSDTIRDFMGEQSLIIAASIYIIIGIASVVIAPIASMPFLPILANIWNSFWAGIISIIAWTIGNLIAFHIAKRCGQSLVKKLVSKRDIESIREYLPEEEDHLFRSLVLLRIIFPVDVLSYALGLFAPDIKEKTFFWSTLLGIAPGALIFAYVGTISILFQIVLFIIAFFVFYFGARYIKFAI